MKRALVTSLFLTLGLMASGASLTPAHAEDPIDVTNQITDKGGALGRQQVEVRQALDRFFDRTGLQLFVAYVPTFGDLTGAEWAARTSEVSGLGRGDVLLAIATKDRSYGTHTDNTTFTADDLETVDRTRILPALANDDFAGAAIEAADGFGDLAEDEGLPWGGIVIGVVVVLVIGALLVRRSRRRFERSHHVLDEHGNPVDPAALLDLEELDDAAMPDEKRRKTMSRIIAICEEVDHSLDARAESFDALRDWNDRVPQLLDGLSDRADELVNRRPTGQAAGLVIAAQEQIERARKELADDEPKYAIAHTRAAEEAIAQATMLLDDQHDPLTAVDEYVTTHRAAVRAGARTLLSEAGRHQRAGDEAEAARLVDAARSAAESDVAAWNGRQETRGDRRRSPNIEALVLGGILVKPIGRNGLGGIGSLLGGSTHGGGSGEPYGGSQRPGSTRTPGSFGGTRTRGRRGGRGRF